MKFITTLILIPALLLVACQTSTNSQNSIQVDPLTYDQIEDGIKVTEQGVKYLVNPDKIRKGIQRPGDVKDVIPSIDNPTFVSVEDASEWIEDNELVLYLEYKDEKRIYPLQILVWHEIVNDVVAKDPLLITYCPLCGSGIAYDRLLDNKSVEFGTSGKLYNSNLVMYDRDSETYWTQIDGLAIVGEKTGQSLTPISIDTLSWGAIKNIHTDTQVLDKPGTSRNYGQDPYGGYYEDDFLIFPVENEDNETGIHPKDVVFGITINNETKAYQESVLIDNPIIQDTLGGLNITVTRDEIGIVKILDQDGNEIVKERDFWFAWYAFHPETTVYGLDN